MMGLCTEGKPASVLLPSPDISSIKEYEILLAQHRIVLFLLTHKSGVWLLKAHTAKRVRTYAPAVTPRHITDPKLNEVQLKSDTCGYRTNSFLTKIVEWMKKSWTIRTNVMSQYNTWRSQAHLRLDQRDHQQIAPAHLMISELLPTVGLLTNAMAAIM
jgi:hypothetical protein